MRAPRTFAFWVPCLFGVSVDAATADYATLDDARLEALIEEALDRNPESPSG